jgi:hypothetical protein
MGFEYVYAYMENIQWFIWTAFAVSSLSLAGLCVARCTNQLDVDDWQILMLFNVPIVLVFALLASAPSMDHIKHVKDVAVAETTSSPTFMCGPSNFIFKDPIVVDKQSWLEYH